MGDIMAVVVMIMLSRDVRGEQLRMVPVGE